MFIIEESGIDIHIQKGTESFPVKIKLIVRPTRSFWGRILESWAVLWGIPSIHLIYVMDTEYSSLLKEIGKNE